MALFMGGGPHRKIWQPSNHFIRFIQKTQEDKSLPVSLLLNLDRAEEDEGMCLQTDNVPGYQRLELGSELESFLWTQIQHHRSSLQGAGEVSNNVVNKSDGNI